MAAAAPITNSGSILDNPQNLQQWSNLIDSLFGTNRTTTTSGTSTTGNSSAADGPLQALIAQLMSTMGQGSNSAQMQALLGPIFAQLRDSALPGIQGMANAGGGVYNSTTQNLLQNDALARATAQGGGLMLTQQNNMQTQLATLLSILAKSTAQQTTNNNQTQQQKTPGNAGNAAKAALGAAAAGQAAKALKDLFGGKANGSNSTGQDFEGDRNSSSASEFGGQGRSDSSDDTSGLNSSGNGYNSDSDPASFFGTEDAGANGFSDPNQSPEDFSWLDGLFDPEGDWKDFGGNGGFGDSFGEDFGASF